MSESAGRVLMIPKGTYSPTTTYDPLDAVKYEQNSYICKQTSRGNLPTNTTYWQPLTDVTADENPTEDSTNLVQSGGVYSALRTINQTLTNNVDVLIENGAINLLPIKCPNQTENNVTLTNNNDGSVTISGTASANTYFYLLENSRSHLEIIEGTGKSYTLSGCTSGSGSTYALRMLGSTDLVAWYTVGQIQTTEEMTFTEGAYPYYAVRIDVFSGASVNVTIKPMLVDSKYKGVYQPYAKTNRELTEENEILIGSLIGDQTFSSNRITKKNGIVTINAAFQADKDYGSFTKFVNIPSEFFPISGAPIGFLFNDTQKTAISVTAFSDGKIQASAKITAGEYYRMAMTYIIT